MMFQNPLLLLGLGAAVIPLVLHLLSRARYRDVDWAAMMFLQGADARQRQSSRLSQFLLLLVRGATVGLLAVALARPVLRGQWAGGAAQGQVAAAIVLDCSASMGFDEAGHTRFDAAKAAARKVLEGLQPGVAATVVFAGADAGAGQAAAAPASSLPPTTDLRAVADRIAAARLGYGPANLARALRTAAELLRPSGGTRDVYVLSDRQALSWNQVDDGSMTNWRRREARPTGPRTRVFVVPVGGTDAQNVSVESIELLAPPAVRGQPAEVEITLRNRGPVRWAALPVALRAGGGAADRKLPDAQVNLAPDSVASTRVSVTFDQPGSHVLSAEVKTPGLTSDDRLEVAVEVVEPLKVLVVSGDERPAGYRSESHFLRVALAPFQANGQAGPDPFAVQVIAVEQWPQVRLRDFQVVVLANVERLTPARAQSLEQFVYDGGGLLVAPGSLSRYDDYNAQLYKDGAGILPARLYPPTAADGSQATALLGIDLEHEIFRFARGRPDPLPPATIARYFPTTRRADAKRLAEYGSGDAFLVGGESGRGRVLLLTLPLDADWSTLPLSNFYLPFVQSACRYLASGAIADRNLGGRKPLVADVEPAAGRAATLELPDGSRAELPVLRFGGRAEARYADADRPGLYRLLVHGGGPPDRALTFVVPPPRVESDLSPLSDDRWRELEQGLPLRRIDPREGPIAEALAAPRGGRELWGPALGAVLFLAVCEMAIARALSRNAG
jgi:hypothetical protein